MSRPPVESPADGSPAQRVAVGPESRDDNHPSAPVWANQELTLTPTGPPEGGAGEFGIDDSRGGKGSRGGALPLGGGGTGHKVIQESPTD